ncbi:MAG TPA: PhzF family phenazine biosynthesis protein [Methylovirgula sp.]|nr:PhzF family phenazine biosynthesis protein [Methylovirgula sp.]
MRRKYYVLDVFTERALAGNPLAAVIDCDGLDTSAMQKIAAEFNLSETIFLFEPHDPVNTARLRIFTPRAELPFAGHPTLGAAILVGELRARDLLRGQDLSVVLEEPIGAIACVVRHRPGKARQAHFTLPRLPSRVGMPQSSDRLAAALGLSSADIGFDRHVPSIYSAGTAFTFVPVATLSALAGARVRADLFPAAFTPAETAHAFLYTRECVAGHDFHARMFAPTLGITEDPATGSAAAAFAGVLMAFEKIPDGNHALVIEQGFEMERPSLIILSLDVEKGVLVEAQVGGAAVIVAEGHLDL